MAEKNIPAKDVIKAVPIPSKSVLILVIIAAESVLSKVVTLNVKPRKVPSTPRPDNTPGAALMCFRLIPFARANSELLKNSSAKCNVFFSPFFSMVRVIS